MGVTHGDIEHKINPPHPVFGFAENRMGWGLYAILKPWVTPMATIVMPFQGILEVSEHFNSGRMPDHRKKT